MAALVLQLSAGCNLHEALSVALGLLNTESDDEYTVFNALIEARDLAQLNVKPIIAINKLGGGWIAEEALAIAVYACLKGRTLEEVLLISVNHSGDSDSTGSISGNLAGAMYGVGAIPDKWLERLELRGVIQEVADDLHDCGRWELSHQVNTPESKRITEKYPSW
jgi:ADP-ribosylglycohydrolase